MGMDFSLPSDSCFGGPQFVLSAGPNRITRCLFSFCRFCYIGLVFWAVAACMGRLDYFPFLVFALSPGRYRDSIQRRWRFFPLFWCCVVAMTVVSDSAAIAGNRSRAACNPLIGVSSEAGLPLLFACLVIAFDIWFPQQSVPLFLRWPILVSRHQKDFRLWPVGHWLSELVSVFMQTSMNQTGRRFEIIFMVMGLYNSQACWSLTCLNVHEQCAI